MIEILGYLSAILIGISLGMVGSGGSILTVPVLVYLMGLNPLVATASSLFIVGVTSFVGGIRSYKKGLVDFKAVTEFGLPSILSIFIARHYLLPALPERIFTIGSLVFTKEVLLMVVFALLMLAASISMMLSNRDEQVYRARAESGERVFPLFILGLLIGLITGMLGAGGGFLIIPSLVLFLGLSMKTAIGTSLILIAVNSLFGFVFSLKQYEYDWKILIGFTILAIAGLLMGSTLANRISANALKKGFGVFILLMAVYIVVKELLIDQY